MAEMTIRLRRYFQAFIEDQISAGKFDTPEEVISEGLRILEEREFKRESLEDALRRGEESGEAVGFDFDAWREAKYQQAAHDEAA